MYHKYHYKILWKLLEIYFIHIKQYMLMSDIYEGRSTNARKIVTISTSFDQ